MITRIVKPPNLITSLQVLWKKSNMLYDTKIYSQQTPQCGEGEPTQFLPQKNGITVTTTTTTEIYFRLKEIKDQSNALGEPYLDLIQRVNCKKAIFEKNEGKRFRIR